MSDHLRPGAGVQSDTCDPKLPSEKVITTELLSYKWILKVMGSPERPISEELERNAKRFSKYKLIRKYGKAKQYLCYDCNRSATVWSYEFNDENEFRTEEGTRFSLSAEKYVPRCGICSYNWLATNTSNEILLTRDEHVKHVPIMFLPNYEIRFCNKCGNYRRFPRKGYYAKTAFPSLSTRSIMLTEFS